MSALLSGIHDRSTVVQKQYAFALGHLVRVSNTSVKQSYYINYTIGCSQWLSMGCYLFFRQTAKDSSVEKLLLKLNSWYLEKEGKEFTIFLRIWWYLCAFNWMVNKLSYSQSQCTSPHAHWPCTPSATIVLMCWRAMPGWLCRWHSWECIRRQALTRRRGRATTPHCGVRCGRRTFQVRNTQRTSWFNTNHYICSFFFFFLIVIT